MSDHLAAKNGSNSMNLYHYVVSIEHDMESYNYMQLCINIILS